MNGPGQDISNNHTDNFSAVQTAPVLPSIEELRRAIERVRRRRNLILHVQQIGWRSAAAVGLFTLGALLEMILHPATPVRILLFGLIAVAVAVGGWRYVQAVRRFSADDQRLAHYVDDHIPDLEQRLLTAMDSYGKQGSSIPSRLVEALWRDAVVHVCHRNLAQVTTSRPAWYAAGTAMALACVLAGALWNSSGFLEAAQRLIRPWSIPAGETTLSSAIDVTPGDILVRRGSDVDISAKVNTRAAGDVFLVTQQPNGDWKRTRMRGEDRLRQYRSYLSGVQSDTPYYVTAGNGRSQQYRIRVFDLTRLESIDVTYTYPVHTGLANKTEKNVGDIIAPEGTRVRVQIGFSRPVQKGLLKFDDGSTLDLTADKQLATAEFVVTKDGSYAVDAQDSEGRNIENPQVYIVRAISDSPPEIVISDPGRDLKVMALAEVTVNALAEDDFGLTRFTLHYSVAGGAEQEVALLGTSRGPAPATVDGKTVIYLEDLQVAPGDVVTYHLTASDNNGIAGPSEVISDIYFLEVIRTDAAFSRGSGQGGGRGQNGRGRSASALVESQKNIIAATWKLLNRQAKTPPDQFTEDVGILAASQKNLAQRAQMSLNRLSERFSFTDESFDQAVIHLFKAVAHMQSATETLFSQRLKEALGPEQAALQELLKAEAQSRRSTIQMTGNRGGSGLDGQGREREDLQALFEMEMGRLENRYEMPAAASGSNDAGQEDLIQRLRRLAQRQQRLNRSQADAERRENRMTEAQRKRHLEELRREQESLRRQAAALSQRLSKSGRTRSLQNSLDQAIDRMREAARNLERQDPAAAAASGRQALQNLRDQEQRLAHGRAGRRSDDPTEAPVSASRPERIRRAAEDAAALLRELEQLKRQTETFGRRQPGEDLSNREPDSVSANPDGKTPAAQRGMRDGYGRVRRYAQALLQPWSRGEDWAFDARSIYRELNHRQIEDFMRQPELWQSLITPARELALRLKAEREANRLKDSPFSPSQPPPPDRYREPVESYYRSLSEITEKR